MAPRHSGETRTPAVGDRMRWKSRRDFATGGSPKGEGILDAWLCVDWGQGLMGVWNLRLLRFRMDEVPSLYLVTLRLHDVSYKLDHTRDDYDIRPQRQRPVLSTRYRRGLSAGVDLGGVVMWGHCT
jgi:hypothetical protein